MGTPDMSWVIATLAFSQWLVGVSNLLQAVLGALRKVYAIAAISFSGIILGVAIFTLLLLKGGVGGAALGLVLMPAMLGVTSFFACLKILPEEWRHPLWRTKREDLRELVSYSVVMVFTTTALPTAHMFVRDIVAAQAGWQVIGYWQGVLKISDLYMQFVAMMGIYYALPCFSAQTSLTKLDAEFRRILIILLVTMAAGFVVLYAGRDLIVSLLFSGAFAPMRDYFLPYMIGDLFRIAGVLCTYYALSRGARGLLVLYELTMAFSLFAAACLLLPRFGGMAPPYAHAAASLIACIVIAAGCFYYRKKWGSKTPPNEAVADEAAQLRIYS